METALTKSIKKRIPAWRPVLKTEKRTTRFAYEVWTPTGIVDVIRFEDYVKGQENRYICSMGTCIKGQSFSDAGCVGCVFKKWRECNEMGILTTCFEVKISVSDFKSENGHNFHGNHNYYVVPSEIYKKVLPLVPDGIGLIAYYRESGHMAEKKPSILREVSDDVLSRLLYDALKKWVDGCWYEYNQYTLKEATHD